MITKMALLTLPALPNLWAIWHAYRHTFPTAQERLLWLGAGVFLPVLGGLIYLFFGRQRVTGKLELR